MKIERVNSELVKQIAYVINNELKDPRITVDMITVTKVKTTPDLKYAKVYLSFFTDDMQLTKESLSAIQNASGFIRNQLKDRVQVRLLPELTFCVDDSIQYGMKIEKILKEIKENEAAQTAHDSDKE